MPITPLDGVKDSAKPFGRGEAPLLVPVVVVGGAVVGGWARVVEGVKLEDEDENVDEVDVVDVVDVEAVEEVVKETEEELNRGKGSPASG